MEAQSWVNYHFVATKATQFFSESGPVWAVICLGALMERKVELAVNACFNASALS